MCLKIAQLLWRHLRPCFPSSILTHKIFVLQPFSVAFSCDSKFFLSWFYICWLQRRRYWSRTQEAGTHAFRDFSSKENPPKVNAKETSFVELLKNPRRRQKPNAIRRTRSLIFL
jgi:hypothetical protein